MTKTFKVFIGDLTFKFIANTNILRCPLDPAGAVPAVFLHNALQTFHKLLIAVEFYIRWQFHKNILSAAAAHPARLS